VSALVRWLPKLAVASADDIARFGPNAARVRSLLDFLPTMSDEAARAAKEAEAARNAALGWDVKKDVAWRAVLNAARNSPRDAARDKAWRAARDATRGGAWDSAWDAAPRAVEGEVVSDLISPENYRSLTNPLATGRAVDVLAPRYKNTPFRELLQELAPKRVITQPTDVLGVGRIASLPDEVAIREAIDLVANYGMTFEEALNVIRMV
jgi:hypothetical protein